MIEQLLKDLNKISKTVLTSTDTNLDKTWPAFLRISRAVGERAELTTGLLAAIDALEYAQEHYFPGKSDVAAVWAHCGGYEGSPDIRAMVGEQRECTECEAKGALLLPECCHDCAVPCGDCGQPAHPHTGICNRCYENQ